MLSANAPPGPRATNACSWRETTTATSRNGARPCNCSNLTGYRHRDAHHAKQSFARAAVSANHRGDVSSGRARQAAAISNDDFQFIELKNTSTTQTLSLSRRAIHRRHRLRLHRQQRHQPCARCAGAGRLQSDGVPVALRNGLQQHHRRTVRQSESRPISTPLASGQVGREAHARRFRRRNDPQLQLPGRLVQADRRQRQFARDPRRRGRRPRVCGTKAKAGSPATRPTARRARTKRPPTRPMPSSSTNSSRIAPTSLAPWAIGSNSTTRPPRRSTSAAGI